MKNSIIIDGNNLMYRALNVFNLSYNGKSTSMIYGVPSIIRGLVTQLAADQIYVVFDGGKAQERLALLPNYKKRDKGSDFDYKDFIRQKNIVIKILETLGVPVIIKKGMEADDLIWLVARRIKKNRKIIIVSTDKDFNQLISKRVSIWNTHMNKRLSHKNLLTIKGYKPEETVDWLILDGDKSDNIPGIPGMGKVTIRKFLDEHKSIKNYLTSATPIFKKFDRKSMEETFLLNRQLIDIRDYLRRNNHTLKNVGISLKPKKKKIKLKKFNLLISKYDIRAFTKDNFIKVFKRLDYD